MSRVGSMAVWCVATGESDVLGSEVHFNYWRVAGDRDFKGEGREPRDFAEIGLLLRSPAAIAKACIFIPAAINDLDVEDCGKYFSQVDIAQGIFNEPLTSTSAGPPGPARVELSRQGTPYGRVHLFQSHNGIISESQLTLESEADGTVLTITRQAIDECSVDLPDICPIYFRLRVFFAGSEQPFVRHITPRDHYFQSGFEEIEYVDFRLNEARTLPSQIETRMRLDRRAASVPLQRVAFLTAVPVAATLTESNRQANKSRLLEHGLWNKYVPGGIPNGMMVYHWREDRVDGVQDFSAFVKLQVRKSDKGIILTYITAAFVFGILGNLAAGALQHALGW